MANNFSGTHYLKIASALATAEPITLAAKFYNLSNSGAVMGVTDSVTGDDRALYNKTASVRLSAASIRQGVALGEAISATFSTSTWYSGVAVFRSTTSRDVYLDGTKTSNTTSVSPRTPSGTWFGSSQAFGGWSGWLASMGVWNVALTDDEINSLVKGFPPNRVRPQSLLACIKAINAAVDMKGNALTISISGYADHPRVYGG